jgi:hypothetical protein
MYAASSNQHSGLNFSSGPDVRPISHLVPSANFQVATPPQTYLAGALSRMTLPPDGLPPDWRPFRQLSLDQLERLVASRRSDPGTLAAIHYELLCRSGLPGQVALLNRIERMLSQPVYPPALPAQSGDVRRLGAGTQHSLPSGGAPVRMIQGATIPSAPAEQVPRAVKPRGPIPEWVRTVLIVAAAVLIYNWFDK